MSEFVPGLAGVVAAKSAIGFINGLEGILRYRGIPIEELAEKSSFEEVSYLLLFGELPKKDQLESFDAELKSLRAIPDGVIDILKALPKDGHPMVALQAATAALGAFYPQMDVTEREGNRKASLRLIASMPTVVAAFDRIRKGKPIIAPDTQLNHAANFVYMVTGEKPDEKVTRLVDVCLILHAEHGFNASTFTGRVVGSTLANPYSVIAGAIGSLSGPLHGGANERVLHMLNTIDSVDDVPGFLDHMIETKQKIMGLGHRVYKVKDPRSTVLQTMAHDLFESHGSTPLYDIAHKLEEVAAERLGDKGIYPNVDFYSGLVYEKLGIEVDLFTPVFAIARVSGWAAHWLEQLEDNRIYRPTQKYVGSLDAHYVD
ncbi:MAG: citrate synthase, partial [Myxococcales bacterium]|nr:citrate synthase [Myxococcales bacterium]